jgi:hypothetical protein
MRRFLRAGFVAAALASGAIIAASAQAGSVRGIVQDEVTHAPLAAWVTVLVNQPDSLALSTPTDGEGRYEILNIPAGNQSYVVTASAAGHTSSYASFENLGSTSLTYDILLPAVPPPPPPGDPDSTLVSGTVVVASGSNLEPVVGAAVLLSSSGGSFGLATGAAGHYSIRVPTGVYAVTVSAGGYQTLAIPAVPVAGTSLVLDAALHSTVGVTPGPFVGFALFGAVPHPLNADGAVSFALPVASRVSLRLYDATGRLRATLLEGERPQGVQSVRLRTGGLGSGVYLVRMEAAPVAGGAAFTASKRVIVLR